MRVKADFDDGVGPNPGGPDFDRLNANIHEDLNPKPPRDTAPPGFGWYKRPGYVTDCKSFVLVPTRAGDQMFKADVQMLKGLLRQYEIYSKKKHDEDAEREKQRLDNWGDSKSPMQKAKEASLTGDAALDTFLRIVEDPKPVTDYDPVKQMPVFTWENVRDVFQAHKTKTSDRDAVGRMKSILQKLQDVGPLRKIACFTDLDKLDELEDSCPNFGEVIQMIRSRMILATHTGKFHIPPILMVGPPGVGKTRFAQAMANLMDTSFYRVSMDSGTTSTTLVGSDSHWANTQMGQLAKTLIYGKTANPVIVLDEMDKATEDGARYSLMHALHALLEPETAHEFRDLSIHLNFDISRVIWIGTANSLKRVPDSIRSRLRIFDIGLPVGDQILQVARSVAREAIKRTEVKHFEPVSDALMKEMAGHSPRAISQMIEQGVCNALSAGRMHLMRTDVFPGGHAPAVEASKPEPKITMTEVSVRVFREADDKADADKDDATDTDKTTPGKGGGGGNGGPTLH